MSICWGPAMQADQGNNLLRRVNLTSGFVSTIAGGVGGISPGYADRTGTAAAFNAPIGVALNRAPLQLW